MKFVVSTFLVFAMLIVSFSKSMVCISFTLNRDYISKNLCENRHKPKLHCNGKCHFIKSLKKENKKENLPSNIKTNLEIQFFSEKTNGFSFSNIYSGEVLFAYSECKTVYPVFSFFIPPEV